MNKNNNDINQVSMSSIEPAANLNVNLPTMGDMHPNMESLDENANDNDSSETPIKQSQSNNGYMGEKIHQQSNDVSIEDQDENDEEHNIDNIDQVPQFTIGQLKPPEQNSVFKGIQSKKVGNSKELQSDRNKSNFEDFRKKYGDQTRKSKQGQPKRKLLKKNDFESDQGLSTGRFEAPQNEEQLSKSANQAKILNIINSSQKEYGSPSNGSVRDFDKLSVNQDPTNLENEMRETSYFKQQTDDEGAAKQQSEERDRTQDFSHLISITNQQKSEQASNLSSAQADTQMQTSGAGSMSTNKNKYRRFNQNEDTFDKQSNGNNSVQQSQRSQNSKNKPSKIEEGIQLFKMQSRSQMKNKQNTPSNINNFKEIEAEIVEPNTPLSPKKHVFNPKGTMQVDNGTPMSQKQKISRAAIDFNGKKIMPLTSNQNGGPLEQENILRSQTYNQGGGQNPIFQEGETYEDQRQRSQMMDKILLEQENNTTGSKRIRKFNMNRPLPNPNGNNYEDESGPEQIEDNQLKEIKKLNKHNQQQQQINNVTANFGELKISKQNFSSQNRNNYSVLKGPEMIDPHNNVINDNLTQNPTTEQQMFTSMSDIGFPKGKNQDGGTAGKDTSDKQKGELPKRQIKTGEIITTDQIQRMMNTQNNWRVRTKTIDEMLHDVADRIQSDSEYIMNHSERFLDFFVQLLADQNFKIVLNTLNILNMIIGMPQQKHRYEKILKQEIPADREWGISNASFGRHISLIVKKLADSKNIIRQEAIKCLFGINQIMRMGNKKDNNFIALILPYLNNSSNWHIREELLNLLIKCFLTSQDQNEFDAYQVLDSILQLFNDQKEKIRILALEAVAAYTTITDKQKIVEVMFQLNVNKEFLQLVTQRIDDGMYPTINNEGNIDLPYKDQLQNYDVDSVAHSMHNQGQINQQIRTNNNYDEAQQDIILKRKQSIGVSSQKGSLQNKMRGGSSGRKIVAATANATKQQLGVSHHDEIMQQAHLQSKRTASANNPNQLEFDNSGIIHLGQNFIPDHNPANSFSYSVGQPGSRVDDQGYNYDLNGSSFLPKLQKVVSYGNEQNNQQYLSSQQHQRERAVGSSGHPGMGYMGLGQGNIDPNLFVGKMQQQSVPITGQNKRSNKYLHGTPGHGAQNYNGQMSKGKNLNQQFNRGNSGKIMGIHHINNSISNPSPSLLDQNTNILDMSGNIGSLLGNEFQNTSSKLNDSMYAGANGNSGHVKHISNIGEMNESHKQGSGHFSQQLSELGNVDHEFLSNAANYTNYHQTPSSFNQEQILYSAGGYRGEGSNQMMGHDRFHQDFQDANSSFNLGKGVGFAPPDTLYGKNNQSVAKGNKGMRLVNDMSSNQSNNFHPATAHSQNISEMIADGSPSHISSHINVIDGGFNFDFINQSQMQNPHILESRGAESQGRGNNYRNNVNQQLGNVIQPANIKFQSGNKNQKDQKNNQNTFYSDHTATTGITATTGATSQNKGGQNQIKQQQMIMVKGNGQQPPNQQQEHQQQQIRGGGQVGPIKATRAALGGGQNQDQDQELVIDSRRKEGGSAMNPKLLKINAKMQSQPSVLQPKLKRQETGQSEQSEQQDPQLQNRSFSYTNDNRGEKGNNGKQQNSGEKEMNSAQIRQSFNNNSMIGDENAEDPALLTQSSKIQYIETADLEPLEKPEKEFKKSIAKGQGIFSKDWFVQFEACNVIRQVCKHHQSLILQIGNQLQSLIASLVKLADSLRSALSRIALITLDDMFVALKRVMEPSLDPIMKVLMKKGAETNQFIVNESDKCMASLVQNCQESKVLQILLMQNMNNRSNLARLKICMCLQSIVKQLGNNILFFKDNDKLLVQLAKYLQDASQDVRHCAKIAFVMMSQAIMGQNELERLLQRVLNEVQYKKVKETLEKEPNLNVGHQGSQIDFVITNANNQNQGNNALSKKMPNKQYQQSFKNLKVSAGLAQKQQQAHNNNEFQDEPLNIQAKSILNPSLAQMQKNESSNYLSKISQQNKNVGSKSQIKSIAEAGEFSEKFASVDQQFIELMKELILKTQVNEWRFRLENSEALFDLVRTNAHLFTKTFKMVELADSFCRLLNDSNAKIQLYTLDQFGSLLTQIFPFIETYVQILYKSIIQNLGSSNLGVRKNSENILRILNESLQEKTVLLQPLVSMIQYNSNARLKPALIDQLVDLLDNFQDVHYQQSVHLTKNVLPVAYKLLEDNKNEIKQRTERLLRKLYSIIGQQVIDHCPQTKLQRVCDIVLSSQKISNGTGSSGKMSGGQNSKNSGFGQGSFGANGNQLHLNSRT